MKKNQELSEEIGRMMRDRLLDDLGMLAEFETIAQLKVWIRNNVEDSEDFVDLALKTVDWKAVFEEADLEMLKDKARSLE